MKEPRAEQWEEWMRKSLIDGTVLSGDRTEMLIDPAIWLEMVEQTKKEIWRALELMNKIGVKNGYEKALEENQVEAKEGVILAIRDKWLEAIRRDLMEPDKVLCHIGAMLHAIACVMPLAEYPKKEV